MRWESEQANCTARDLQQQKHREHEGDKVHPIERVTLSRRDKAVLEAWFKQIPAGFYNPIANRNLTKRCSVISDWVIIVEKRQDGQVRKYRPKPLSSP